MDRIRNIVFTVLAAGVLLLVIGNLGVKAVSGSHDFAARSYLEGRTYQGLPEPSVDAVATGAFQSSTEQFLADHIPKRDSFLLGNAAVERTLIELANVPFGFSAYPTFFDSGDVFVPEWGSVVGFPLMKANYSQEKLEEGSHAWAAFVEKHPDTHWCLALVDRASTSSASPVYGFVSDSADYAYFASPLSAALDGLCDVLDLSYAATDEFMADYYKTDHHWQVQGAVKAYDRIMDLFGRRAVPIDGFTVAYDGDFYGSSARNGLITSASDVVYDVNYEPGAFSVRLNGKKAKRSAVDESLADGYDSFSKSRTFSNVYADYFHGDYALIEYDNPDAPDGTLLVIGDSFTDCIDRLFAESYRHVSVVDPRHFEGSLAEYVDELQPDDAVVMMGAISLFDADVVGKLK